MMKNEDKEVGGDNNFICPLSLYPCLFPVLGTFLVLITPKAEKNPNDLIFIDIKSCKGYCLCWDGVLV